ncbi:MATE family efflux transporter [Streptococcus pneumoniae]|uniref:MATE family efflux transporter n=1 Tax=Streptococcus pneumoniae TaxID=1313 RepID=UPI0005DE70B4|nr:MATE family efflux transporter [Streptococcus pneumoniae]CJE10741.1 multi antimicrobial extrusion (MATE) family transporter [Streptococcus pneumoniae]COQ33326.1 multi antimicrobial extrusion (MATE) family transporter [Streptococcus pneumoniae]
MFKKNKDILNIALPAMGENFLQMLMGMVDSYLVAHLGLIAISGVSVAGNIITIYQAIFIALGAAISSVISKSIGQKDQSKLAYHVTEALKITLLLSFLLGFLSIFAGLVGGSIVLLGLMTSLGALIRATHNPRLPLYVSFLSNALNILFSSLAIFVLDMGIAGVAWGTILSRLVGLVILWSQLKLPYGKPTFGLDKELLTLALPAAGERLMMRAGDVVIIALVVSFGTEAVAGNAIGEVLTQFNYMPAFGVATATVMLLARAVGEDDWKRVASLSKQTFWLSLFLMLPLSFSIYVLGVPLTHLYTTDSLAVEASVLVTLFSLLGTPMTTGTVIYTAVWQGLGNARLPFYATSIGMWCIRIGTGYLLGIVLGWGLPGIWAGSLLDNGFRWLFLRYRYQRYMSLKG